MYSNQRCSTAETMKKREKNNCSAQCESPKNTNAATHDPSTKQTLCTQDHSDDVSLSKTLVSGCREDTSSTNMPVVKETPRKGNVNSL